ncbi:MAG: hypothetical protein ABL308_12005 [Oceanicaulis sp.]
MTYASFPVTALIAVILVGMGLLVTGFILQARRWRKPRRKR